MIITTDAKSKSVSSINLIKSVPVRRAGVIQTIYNIVKAHGGKILMSSTDGKGCEFIIELPLTP